MADLRACLGMGQNVHLYYTSKRIRVVYAYNVSDPVFRRIFVVYGAYTLYTQIYADYTRISVRCVSQLQQQLLITRA
jgi:hypothetical protein